MNKKTIFLIIFVLILILFGYILRNRDSSPEQDYYNSISNKNELSDKEISNLFANLGQDIKVGEFESLDTDDDGSDDKYVLTLNRQEVAEDLFLDKSIEYEKTEEGFIGTLTLDFENLGDEKTSYVHIEEIPKSFAKHINDLEFSVQPTKIINPDPVMSWEMQVINRNNNKIIIKAKKAAIAAALKADPVMGLLIATGMNMSGEPSEKMIKAGKDAAGNVVFSNLDAFTFIYAMNDCSKFGGEGALWNTCIINLMTKFPDKFIEDDCEGIDISHPDAMNNVSGSVLQGMCKAIVTESWEKCHDDIDTWDDIDKCKLMLFKSFSRNCELLKNKDDCIYNATVKANSRYGCNYITDKTTKNGCFAEITQDIAYCKKIDDKDEKSYCCSKIVDADASKNCLGEEKKEKSDEKEEISCGDDKEHVLYGSCIRTKAKDVCDTEICLMNFERIYDINECIDAVASGCGVDYCLDMKDSQTFYNKVVCIWRHAKDKKDCELIGDEEYQAGMGKATNKKSCLENINL